MMSRFRVLAAAGVAAAATAAAVDIGAVQSAASQIQRPEQRPAAVQPVIPAALRERIRIDDVKLRRHVIRPAHVLGVTSDDHSSDSLAAAVPALPSGRPTVPRPVGPRLDVGRFGQALHVRLRSSVAGYAMRLQHNGTPIYTLQWEWARRPGDGSVAWTPDRRQHIASVSKLITAIGMVRALEDRGISYDAKIIDYLPPYWKKGPKIDTITFRQLLRHTSGFSTGGSQSDFTLMKSKVAEGVAGTGMYDYENMNFGLCRILIPFVLYGDFLKAFSFADEVWDYITITAYTEYMQNKIFGPSGVTGATLAAPSNGVLAYAFPPSSPGWNSGDLSTMSGGAGWHMSVNEVLRVLATFRHKNSILPPAKAQAVLDAGLGIDQIHETPAGRIYNKNGRWTNGDKSEQSVAFILPDGMELVVLVNSPIVASDGKTALSLRDIVRETYVANIK